MKLGLPIALAALLVPTAASAQFSDLDTAIANLERGLAAGDVDAIVAGIGQDQQVMLDFPGLADGSGMFGRDQAAYLLDGLFNRARPTGFERLGAKGNRAQGEYLIAAKWHIAAGARDLYIRLKYNGGRWSVAAIRSPEPGGN